jgi:hypothetical protein
MTANEQLYLASVAWTVVAQLFVLRAVARRGRVSPWPIRSHKSTKIG